MFKSGTMVELRFDFNNVDEDSRGIVTSTNADSFPEYGYPGSVEVVFGVGMGIRMKVPCKFLRQIEGQTRLTVDGNWTWENHEAQVRADR